MVSQATQLKYSRNKTDKCECSVIPYKTQTMLESGY